MKKQIERFKVRIDQNLNRTEKTVALSPELVKVEETIGVYKQVLGALQKKLSEDLQGYGKGTDGSAVERRLKKTGDFVLGNIFSEVGRNLHKQNPASCLGNVLTELGDVFPRLANYHVNYEISVEQLIITKLQDILNTDLPKIKSSRGQLDKLLLELDTTKARLEKVREEEQQHSGHTVTTPGKQHGNSGAALTQKIEKLNEELDDILRNVDQARDGLAADMLSFLSRDNEMAGLLSNFVGFRLHQLKESYVKLEETQPKLETLRSSRKGYPIFGTSLQDHIRDLGLESGIAFPLQLCCVKLLELGLDEEGLFRLTAGASKVKRLRAEIEAGHAFINNIDGYDHHVFTGLIKTYLRELPSPLMGEELYNDWLEAGRLTGEDRFNAIWNLLQSDYLPRENYRNIQYLFRFLHEVTLHSDKNKMSANNLAIVITPNVIWSNTAVQDAMDVGSGGVLQQVVELIISQHTWFFQNDPPVLWNQNFAPLKTCLPFTCNNNESADQRMSMLPDLPPSTLTREKSRKVKPKPVAPPPSNSTPSSTNTSYSPNGMSVIGGGGLNSPPSSPQIQYRQHSSPRSSGGMSSSGGSLMLQHPSQPPPKPPSATGVRASIELGSSLFHHHHGGGNHHGTGVTRSHTTASASSTPTQRPRAMTESRLPPTGVSTSGGNSPRGTKIAGNETNSCSPEKLMHQTKDLLNIGTMLVVGPPSSDKQSEEVPFIQQDGDNSRTSFSPNELRNNPHSNSNNRYYEHSTSEDRRTAGNLSSTSSTSSNSSSTTSSNSSPSSAEYSKKEPSSSTYPVPAPRSFKPAIPTKPEGLVMTGGKPEGGKVNGGGLYPNLKEVDANNTDVKDFTKL